MLHFGPHNSFSINILFNVPSSHHQHPQHNDDYIIFTNMVTYYKPRPENGTDELIAREHNLKIPATCYLERTQVLEESFLPEANLYVFEEVRIQLLCSLTLSSSGGGGGAFRDDFFNEKECCAEIL